MNEFQRPWNVPKAIVQRVTTLAEPIELLQGRSKDASEVEIIDGLAPQGIVNVTRFYRKGEGYRHPTNTYLLKFDTPRVPEHIYIGPYRVRVDLFVPNPTRCFNCQSFGHGKATCREPERCVKCSRFGHSSFQCENDAHCSNCDGDHMASSKDCPLFKKEKEIQKIKSENNISYGEARRLYNTVNSQSNKTYASAVKSTSSIGTQTTLSWLNSESTPKEIFVQTSTKPVAKSSTTASSQTASTSSKSVDSTTKQQSSKTNDKTKIKNSSRSASAGNRQTQPAASRHPSAGNRQTQPAAIGTQPAANRQTQPAVNRQSSAGNRQKPNDKQHKSSDRQRKEDRNAIKMFNRFGNLDNEGQDDPFSDEDDFMEVSPSSPRRDRSQSPLARRSQRKISPLPTSQ